LILILKVPYRISRAYIQEHPDWIFVYATDVVGRGAEGHEWQCKGEPNAFGIPTVYKLCPSSSVFFQDSRREEQWQYIINAFEKIPRDKGPIIPFRRIGMGCSRMQEFAPKMFAELQRLLKYISANIEWVYPTTRQ